MGSEALLLKVEPSTKGIFKKRLNRFLAEVNLESGDTALCHVHDPGRLKELLFPGNRVLLRKIMKKTSRKTDYDVISASTLYGEVFLHSGYHSILAERILRKTREITTLEKEVRFRNSRIDFLLVHSNGARELVEIKGCTLARGEVALFPDSPTERGRKHLLHLAEARNEGFNSTVVFLIFRREARKFSPNFQEDPKFAQTLAYCVEEGVRVELYKVIYDPPWLKLSPQRPSLVLPNFT